MDDPIPVDDVQDTLDDSTLQQFYSVDGKDSEYSDLLAKEPTVEELLQSLQNSDYPTNASDADSDSGADADAEAEEDWDTDGVWDVQPEEDWDTADTIPEDSTIFDDEDDDDDGMVPQQPSSHTNQSTIHSDKIIDLGFFGNPYSGKQDEDQSDDDQKLDTYFSDTLHSVTNDSDDDIDSDIDLDIYSPADKFSDLLEENFASEKSQQRVQNLLKKRYSNAARTSKRRRLQQPRSTNTPRRRRR